MNTALTDYALVNALQEDYRARADHHRFVAQNRATTDRTSGRRRFGTTGWLGHVRLSLRGEGPVA